MATGKTLTWRDNLIRPDLSQDGFIAEREGIHGSLAFGYLPPLPVQTETIQGKVEALQTVGKTGEAAGEMIKFVAEYLQSWSENAPVNIDNITIMRPPLLFRLFKILVGASGSDPQGRTDTVAKTGDALLGKS